jgi:hypothetical protein
MQWEGELYEFCSELLAVVNPSAPFIVAAPSDPKPTNHFSLLRPRFVHSLSTHCKYPEVLFPKRAI